MPSRKIDGLEAFRNKHPGKFIPLRDVFARIHKGSHIFIGTACGEPQHLVRSLAGYIDEFPSRLVGNEVIQVWTLGVAPFADEYYSRNFIHNSFFISDKSRDAVNTGLADYTPVFLSRVPELFDSGMVGLDVALIQASLPDKRGNMSLGISVDIVKSAVANAGMVIVQVNKNMPSVCGDSMINVRDADYIVRRDEPLLEYSPKVPDDISHAIGREIARLVRDGDTLQVGYGSMPNAILKSLRGKNDLGIHTELLTDGIVDLMKSGVVNNSRKSQDRGKTVASFCMGKRKTYRAIHMNPDLKFMPVDYTNSIARIMSQKNMTAINSALQIDLSGQSSSESIGRMYFSGIGGQADFMRGAVLARGGKSILAMRSTSNDGKFSRIVAGLEPGSGVTLNRGDIHYVITEYGIAYLHGKNIRERALSLISIAHPDFREGLMEEARMTGIVRAGQKFVPGSAGSYPSRLERRGVTKSGMYLLLRPVKLTDEDILREFFYSLSDDSMYHRFFSGKKYISTGFLQSFAVNDYYNQMVLLAIDSGGPREKVIGIGQYTVNRESHRADVAFAVRDDCQNRGVGRLLLASLASMARRAGLLGFTADVLAENKTMIRLFEKMRFNMGKRIEGSVYEFVMDFR